MRLIHPYIMLTVCLATFVVISCKSHKGVYYQPTNKEFRLSKKDFIYDPVIDTKSIYANMLTYFDGQLEFRTIRFSRDGVCYLLLAGSDSHNVFEINQKTNQGIYGRYYLSDKNKIKLEMYNGALSMMVYWYGTYDEKGVYFDKIGSKRFIDPIRRIGDSREDYYFYKQSADIYTELKIPI